MINLFIGDKIVETYKSSYLPYSLKKEIFEQDKRSRESIVIHFKFLNLLYYIFFDDPLSTKSVAIRTYSNETGIWKLKDDFEKWRFELKNFSPFKLSTPCEWGLGEMLVNLTLWGEDEDLSGFYQSIALWLIFEYITPCRR